MLKAFLENLTCSKVCRRASSLLLLGWRFSHRLIHYTYLTCPKEKGREKRKKKKETSNIVLIKKKELTRPLQVCLCHSSTLGVFIG